MNQISRNFTIAGRFLGITNYELATAGLASHPERFLPLSALSFTSKLWFSSDPSDPTNPDDAQPKKRRGRPPKATLKETPVGHPADSTPAADARAVSSEDQKLHPDVETTATTTTSIVDAAAVDALRNTSSRRPPKPQPVLQGLSTLLSSQLDRRDPNHWNSGVSVTELMPGPDNAFKVAPPNFHVNVPRDALPEAEAAFYYDPILTDQQLKQPHYGCKAATAEFESSGSRSIMHRSCISDLLTAVSSSRANANLATDTNNNLYYVDGWTGSGKSIALYTLAAAARAAQRIVMYIPSAFLMIQGGRYYRREDEQNPWWDTPEAARHIINALVESHANELQSLGLMDIANTGLSAPLTAPQDIVESAIALKDAVLSQDNGMVIIDDYNVLYSHTAYQEPMHQFYRRPISPDELRLASAFRVLEQHNHKGVCVVAPTYSSGISPAIRVPGVAQKNTRIRDRVARTIHIPRYNVNEVAGLAAAYAANNKLTQMPGEIEIRRALALTNGNAKELRELKASLLEVDSPIGLSLGYKAMRAARKEYSLMLDLE